MNTHLQFAFQPKGAEEDQEDNYIPLYPTNIPQPTAKQPELPFFGQSRYAPSYPRSEYLPWQPPEQTQTDMYPNYVHNFSAPPGMGGYPRVNPPDYRYSYPQSEPVYRYPPQMSRPIRGNYYMPPRNSTWTNMPPYDPVNQYYPKGPPGLQTMNKTN